MDSTMSSPASSPQSGQRTITPPDTVYLNESQFVQNRILIKKGASITLIDESSAFHMIANGTWGDDGIAKYQMETGAPKENVQFNGNDRHTIGPFNAVGTFHFYCTVHQDMDLAVIVQE